MVASHQARQATSWESPHDFLVTFAVDLVTFCGVWSSKRPQLTSYPLNFLNQNPHHATGKPTNYIHVKLVQAASFHLKLCKLFKCIILNVLLRTIFANLITYVRTNIHAFSKAQFKLHYHM